MSEPTILVVDDEPHIITLLETWLETIGCKVVSARDGVDGVKQARKIQPDLILMDGMMPSMTGFDACEALKSDPLTEDIPLIFLTVQGEIQDVIKGLELGAHGYMTKPFKPQELLARVRSTLKIKQVQDRLRQHTEKTRKSLTWLPESVASLPVGLVVFDSASGEVVFQNKRWSTAMGSSSGPIWESLSLTPTGPGLRLLREEQDLAGDFLVTLDGQERGQFHLRANSFVSEGRNFRQLVLSSTT